MVRNDGTLCRHMSCCFRAFAKACLHVARVSRVLKQAGGHAMLIGVGGSGKQSLAKLAMYMAELAPMTIVISKNYSLNDFKADLQVRKLRTNTKGKVLSSVMATMLV